MRVKILLFGITRQIIGESNLVIELDEHAKVSDLLDAVTSKYDDLDDLSSLMVAVNNEYASHDTEINEKDEIALIPPVSGG